MYEEYFEMKNTPFTRAIPEHKLYETPVFSDIMGRLTYCADKQLFAVLTSDPGCGKTTLIRKFKKEMPESEYEVLYLASSQMNPHWLYNGLLGLMGLKWEHYRGNSRKSLFSQVDKLKNERHKKVVCIVDEAHLLSHEMLEEFRFFLNTQFDSISSVCLILSGQSELIESKLKRQSYFGLRQRVDMFCQIPHLDRAQTEAYIRTHLAYAECQKEIFTDAALDEIYQKSSGIPRIINRVCEKSLMYAFQQQKHLIDDHMVKHIVQHEMIQ